ncbi:MAG: hypothetical protein RLP14_06820 [Owenweeksia sp.]
MLKSGFTLKAILCIPLMVLYSCNAPLPSEEKQWHPQEDFATAGGNAATKKPPAIRVHLEHKEFYSDAWHDYLIFDFVLHNQSEKDIRALKGHVIFSNIFGEELHRLALSCERTIPACEKINHQVKMTYRPYMKKDVVLKERSLEGLQVQWIPERIIFTDNSTL